MTERVLDECPPDPENPLLVAQGRRVAGQDLQRMPARVRDRPELVPQIVRDLGEVDRPSVDAQAPGIQPREVEEILREPLEAVDLLPHRLEELPPRRLVELLVRQQLDEPAKREERRSQLVRGVADELPPRALELREAEAHPVERAGELPELVAARILDRLVEGARRDPLRRSLEPSDPPRKEVGKFVRNRLGIFWRRVFEAMDAKHAMATAANLAMQQPFDY